MMKLIFTCPVAGREFERGDFRLVDNRGVVVDGEGNRRLDARVRLNSPCPHCGGIHEYDADRLACPFSGGTPSPGKGRNEEGK
ncbi:hypothetical protein [Desulfococcus sp.]|uniref:hypothetical protein n=1 Tax=Desulfococcus sp. TaxID=2025834 RepID=UPI0035944CB4